MTIYLDALGTIRVAPPLLAHLKDIALFDAVEPHHKQEATVIGLMVGISGKPQVKQLCFRGVGLQEVTIDRLLDSPADLLQELREGIVDPDG